MDGGAREPDQADFDLERFIDMFDTALTSNDPRVVETLRKLLMIVALTKPEGPDHGDVGPLRRLYDDVYDLNRKINRLEEEIDRALRSAEQRWKREEYRWEDFEKYTLATAQQVAQKVDQDVINQLKPTAKGLK